MTAKDDREMIERPVGVTPHTIGALVLATIAITASVVGTYISVIYRLETQGKLIADLTEAVKEMKQSAMDDRFRGKDADRAFEALWVLNRDKIQDWRVPIPTSVRDGKTAIFGDR